MTGLKFVSIMPLIRIMVVGLALALIGSVDSAHAKGGLNEVPRKLGFNCDKGLAPQGGKCVPCGHEDGQPACEPMRKGPQCYRYMENVNGTCRARGGNNQLPYSGVGFDCKPGYNVGDNGRCAPCGDNGELVCEPMRKGPQCNDGLNEDDGFCTNRGLEGGEPWPAIRPGFRCEKGTAPHEGICQPCGDTGQPACEPMRAGNRCERAYNQENDDGICEARGGDGQPALQGLGFECRPGFNWDGGLPGNRTCEPCGGLGEIVCEVMREGSICNEGLVQDHHLGRNTCVPSLAGDVEQAAWAWLEETGEGIYNMLLPMAFEMHEDENFLDSLANEDDGAEDEAESRVGEIDLPEFKAISIGATAEANFIIGIGVESGFAFDTHNSPAKKPKWFGSGSASTSIGAGSSYGANVGLWTAENDELAGRSVGLVVDLRDVLGVDSDVLSDIGTQASTFTVLVGVWFERTDDFELGDFAGFTLSPVLGVGSNLVGATYVEATTVQARNASDGTVALSEIKTIEVDDVKTKNFCRGACRIPISDTRAPVRTQSDSARLESSQSASNGALAKANADQAGGYLGKWKIALGGTSLVEEVKIYNAHYIITHRPSSGATTRYEAQGGNEFRAANGARIRFDSTSRGVWISGDGSTTYGMTK